MPHHQRYDLLWLVVCNHEGRFSVWPRERPVPAGWRAVEDAETREDALSRIAEVWTDMRPNRLKEVMA